MYPNVSYLIIFLYLKPDDFTHLGEISFVLSGEQSIDEQIISFE